MKYQFERHKVKVVCKCPLNIEARRYWLVGQSLDGLTTGLLLLIVCPPFQSNE